MNIQAMALIATAVFGLIMYSVINAQTIVAWAVVIMVGLYVGLALIKSRSSQSEYKIESKDDKAFLLLEASLIGIAFVFLVDWLFRAPIYI